MSVKYISFKELKIKYICKLSLKHSYISIKDSEVILKTPRVSKSYIEQLLLEKESWIRKQLLKDSNKELIEFKLGEEILLFGRVESLNSNDFKGLHDSILKLKIKNSEHILKCYNKFYKEFSENYLTKRVEFFSKIMGLNYTQLKFRKMKTRWGSCNSLGRITLNIELLKIKKELIDYVVVHELAHLKHMNHSKEFHSFVEKYLHNSKLLQKELRNIKIATS